MTVDPGLDMHRIAAAARSILACPHEVQLVVDGIDDVTAGLEQMGLEMQDHSGRPILSCPTDSPLAFAATDPSTISATAGRSPSASRARSRRTLSIATPRWPTSPSSFA